jgi:hypothetical protein
LHGQLDLDPETLVFVDETGASTKMACRYSCAPRGERLRMAVPHGHWMTTTFVGGLRLSSMTAPFVIDGPMTGAWFEAWVAQALAPTLKRGDVVMCFSIWTGLGAHRPLGNINRARNETYRHSADFRARVNGCPYHEPAGGRALPTEV